MPARTRIHPHVLHEPNHQKKIYSFLFQVSSSIYDTSRNKYKVKVQIVRYGTIKTKAHTIAWFGSVYLYTYPDPAGQWYRYMVLADLDPTSLPEGIKKLVPVSVTAGYKEFPFQIFGCLVLVFKYFRHHRVYNSTLKFLNHRIRLESVDGLQCKSRKKHDLNIFKD